MLNKTDKTAIMSLVKSIEQKTDAEILVIFADRAGHYRIVPLLYACLLALPLPYCLYKFTSLTLLEMLTLQLILFSFLWLVLSFEPIKLAVTPKFHKTARITQRTRDILWSYNNLNAHPRPLLLIFIAKKEHMALLKSDFIPTHKLEIALERLTIQLKQAKPALAIEKALDELLPVIEKSVPKTARDQNTLQDAPFEIKG